MTKLTLTLTLLLATVPVWAQRTVVGGMVVDDKTGRPLAQANIAIPQSHVSVVTNDDGRFSLKAGTLPDTILVSHIGYASCRMALRANRPSDDLLIRLTPTAIQLQEVVVWTGDPRELVNTAIRKITDNYSRLPELLHGFYRETAMKRHHYIYVAEGVVDMYKTAYGRSTSRDRVAIRKGRRLLSPKRGDTLSIKVMGGPVQPIQLDIAKNLDFLLNADDLSHYAFSLEPSEVIDGRLQYVVSLKPSTPATYALFFGRLYIDRLTLAFTRAELTLDMSDRQKATRYMLIKKPTGVRFKPKELTCLIDYRTDHGITRLSYIRNTFRFNCDWRRRLFATSFTAFCEMVVTDHQPAEGRTPISGRASFDARDAFFDKVDYFRDPHFWDDYNIIEPTERLDHAIGRLMKKHGRR